MNIDRDFFRDVHCVGGLPIDNVDTTACLSIIQQSIEQKSKIFFTTPNLNFVISSLSDREFYDSVVESDLVVADGISILIMSKLNGAPIKYRVAGSDIFEQLQSGRIEKKVTVYFFGGIEGVAERAEKNLRNNQYVQCVGTYYPGFMDVNSMSDSRIIQQINQTSPEILVVALGAKKGQLWIRKNLSQLNTNVVSHLGAVINFVAGTVKRAPKFLQKLGLEWAWRIKEEPALWKRYYCDALVLIQLLASKLLPLAILNFYLRVIGANTKAEPQLILQEEESRVKLMLSGSFFENVSNEHRTILKEAASIQKDLYIDFRQATYLGTSMMALLVMLYGYSQSNRKKFEMVSLSSRCKRQLKYNMLDYLYQA